MHGQAGWGAGTHRWMDGVGAWMVFGARSWLRGRWMDARFLVLCCVLSVVRVRN
jgi:hypothetical protein